ncbi:MAG TPA: response regulator [Longimicrobium sp.]|nr:response regulator [Longimicrobium sp.]
MSPKTLALADDDEMLSELLASFLELEGYDVVRFPSGDALLSWASTSAGPVDAFLLDIDMPGRDGFQSCLALRDIPIYSATPTVFVSSMPAEEVRERVAASGASGMIAKDAEMLPRITTWLAQTLG